MSAQVSPGISDKLVIWRICDGRPGHDNQSRGLVNALSNLAETECHNITSPPSLQSLLHLLSGSFPPGGGLPAPDLITGAGHKTHLAMLAAKRVRGGNVIVIMHPTLPTDWFDLCLVPDHDKPTIKHNIFITHGALNTIVPGDASRPGTGLVLIGGPSRHCDWNPARLREQVTTIIGKTRETTWTVIDSVRTPEPTRQHLRETINQPNASYHSYHDTAPGWLDEQLRTASTVWVTADSISMIYESLTAGAYTGILPVSAGAESKITSVVNELKRARMIVRYEDWLAGEKMEPPPENFNEARRAAEEALKRFGHAFSGRVLNKGAAGRK